MTNEIIIDVGEIGWSMYHRAYLWWRYEHGERPPQINVWTLPDRLRLYESFIYAELKTLPEKYHGNKKRSCFTYPGFYKKQVCEEIGVNHELLVHPFSCSLQYKKMLFKPFSVTEKEVERYDKKASVFDRKKKNIVVMPRHKHNFPRNWGIENWNALLKLLRTLNYNIILCGITGLVCDLSLEAELNLVSDDPFSYTLCALNDPQTVLCVASQSFGGKLSLLQNVNTLMWGDQPDRHSSRENWSTDPGTICKFIHDRHYSISPQLIFEHIVELLKDD